MREQFLLNPEITFLNHGSFGACPRAVFDIYQQWQRELEWQPVEFLGRSIEGLLNEAREKLCHFLGAQVDDWVFIPSATAGVNTAIRALLPTLKPGDEILSTDHEYGACEYAWLRACQTSGARFVRAPVVLPVTTPEAFVDAFWSHVTPRTRVIFLSHITSCTALTFPVAPICARARAAGIVTVIDGAHVPGQLPLALDELGADFYTGNFHKWLCSPKGSAFLHVRAPYQSGVDPLIISWGLAEGAEASFVKRNQIQPTGDYSAYLTVPSALDFQQRHHWRARRAECHALARDLRQRLAEVLGTPPITPDSEVADYAWFAQMVAAQLPANVDPQSLKTRLYDEFQIEIPITLQKAVNGTETYFVRASFQAYNTAADSARLLDALKVILRG